MKEFTYEIKKNIARLSGTENRCCEVNYISFRGADPKIDIRRWSVKDGEKRMGKGICLSADEVVQLREVLNSLDCTCDF
jgi:hypothetical protein